MGHHLPHLISSDPITRYHKISQDITRYHKISQDVLEFCTDFSGSLVVQARFPTTVQIPDFLATELVQFMEISASRLPSGRETQCLRGFAPWPAVMSTS